MALRTRMAFKVDHVVGDGESNAVELEIGHAPFIIDSCNPKFDAERIYRPDEIVVTDLELLDTAKTKKSDKLEVAKAQLNTNGRLSVKFSRPLAVDEAVVIMGWFYFNV
ncbi:MAG: hypothetical protein JWM74_4408 [Myxococcaceae bacterium]|nr:hypothetical protein [Myxococcaceae bacterium]